MASSCAICLCEFENLNYVSTICKHQFHNECLETWLKAKATCPTCRTKLRDGSEEQFGDNIEFDIRDFFQETIPDNPDVSINLHWQAYLSQATELRHIINNVIADRLGFSEEEKQFLFSMDELQNMIGTITLALDGHTSFVDILNQLETN